MLGQTTIEISGRCLTLVINQNWKLPLNSVHLLKTEHLLHLSLLLSHIVRAHSNKSEFAWVDHLLREESGWHHVAVHCF